MPPAHAGQSNPMRIHPIDEAVILPFILGSSAANATTRVHLGLRDAGRQRRGHGIGMAIAMEAVRAALPGEQVRRMPHDNPGFDILVGDPSAPQRYVEVKSTRSPEPVFDLSEGERRFSVAHADRYSLLVVFGIDVAAGTLAASRRYQGAIANEVFRPHHSHECRAVSLAASRVAPRRWCAPAR